jgi:hypothetical protein
LLEQLAIWLYWDSDTPVRLSPIHCQRQPWVSPIPDTRTHRSPQSTQKTDKESAKARGVIVVVARVVVGGDNDAGPWCCSLGSWRESSFFSAGLGGLAVVVCRWPWIWFYERGSRRHQQARANDECKAVFGRNGVVEMMCDVIWNAWERQSSWSNENGKES